MIRVPIGDPINDHFETVCARLAEDCGLTISQIDDMDRELIYAVYFHPRNKDGGLQVAQEMGADEPLAGPATGSGLRGMFMAGLRRHGIVEPEWQERFWREWQAESKAKPQPVPVATSPAAFADRVAAGQAARVGRARAQAQRRRESLAARSGTTIEGRAKSTKATRKGR